MGFDILFDLPSKFPIGRWTLKDPAKQTFEVERSSTHEENRFALRAECVYLLVGEIAVLRNAERVGGRNQIDEVMGNRRLIRSSRFCGPDVHLLVNGHGIKRDDLGIKGLGQLNGGGGFSTRGRTCQKPAVKYMGMKV